MREEFIERATHTYTGKSHKGRAADTLDHLMNGDPVILIKENDPNPGICQIENERGATYAVRADELKPYTPEP